MSNAQSTFALTTFELDEMLRCLTLQILVGNHHRNMKLLEILQGAAVLARWYVHSLILISKAPWESRPTVHQRSTDSTWLLNKPPELVVALRSIESAIVGLSKPIDWLSKRMCIRLKDAAISSRNSETIQYLDVFDEREYSK